MIILSPSILAADFNKLGEQMALAEKGGATWAHLDVMDGNFVPAISFGMPVISSLRKASDIFFDVHLMIDDPIRYVHEFADAGADIITFHYEATDDVGAVIAAIHSTGKKAGLSIKPNTPIDVVFPYLDRLDMVLLMTVEPGFGGQKYIESSTPRIHALREYVDAHSPSVDIEIDGGVTKENVDIMLNAGANIIVTGSAVYRGDICENARFFTNHFAEFEKSK